MLRVWDPQPGNLAVRCRFGAGLSPGLCLEGGAASHRQQAQISLFSEGIRLSSVSYVPSRWCEERERQSLPLANSGSRPAPLLQFSNSFRHQEMVSVPERDVSTREGNAGAGGVARRTAQTRTQLFGFTHFHLRLPIVHKAFKYMDR